MTQTRYLINDPMASFDAHLFEREDVEDAGGAEGTKSDRPVTTICSRSTSYGPFRAVTVDDIRTGLPEHDGDVCGICTKMFENRDKDGDGDD